TILKRRGGVNRTHHLIQKRPFVTGLCSGQNMFLLKPVQWAHCVRQGGGPKEYSVPPKAGEGRRDGREKKRRADPRPALQGLLLGGIRMRDLFRGLLKVKANLLAILKRVAIRLPRRALFVVTLLARLRVALKNVRAHVDVSGLVL